MVPTTETLLKNDFPEGSEATLECANGYVKDSGSGILTCLGGKWTDLDLTCISEFYLISLNQTVAPQLSNLKNDSSVLICCVLCYRKKLWFS